MFKYLIAFAGFSALLICSSFLEAAPVPKPAPLDPLGKSDFEIHFTDRIEVDKDGNSYIQNMIILMPYYAKLDVRKLGFQEGDILRKVGFDKVENIVEYLNKIEQYRPGSVVEFTVERDGKEVKIKAKIGLAEPKNPEEPVMENPEEIPWPG